MSRGIGPQEEAKRLTHITARKPIFTALKRTKPCYASEYPRSWFTPSFARERSCKVAQTCITAFTHVLIIRKQHCSWARGSYIEAYGPMYVRLDVKR